MLETPEGAEAVIGTLERAEAVVRTPEGAGAVVEPLEEAEAETLKRGRGTSGGFRRTAQTGPQVQVSEVSDNVPGKEREGGRGKPKRKRSDDTSLPPKRVKKCRAVHGLDQKELWCKPCINSKKCIKYV